MQLEVLHENPYFRVVTPTDNPYYIVDEGDNCRALVRLPDGRYVVRKEDCPPYQMKDGFELHWTAVSGQLEKGESPMDCILREIREETGYIILETDYVCENNVPWSKGNTQRVHNYFFDVKDFEKEKPKGDGTVHEELSQSLVVTNKQMEAIVRKPNCDAILRYLWFWSKYYEQA